jgi:hypothetical protein
MSAAVPEIMDTCFMHVPNRNIVPPWIGQDSRDKVTAHEEDLEQKLSASVTSPEEEEEAESALAAEVFGGPLSGESTRPARWMSHHHNEDG